MALYDPAPTRLHGHTWATATQLLHAGQVWHLSDWQVGNYAALADALATLPADYVSFNMGVWMARLELDAAGHPTGGLVEETEYTTEDPVGRPVGQLAQPLPECNTVACAMGHAPTLVAPALPDETWNAYGRRVFGGYVAALGTDQPVNQLFTWCYDSGWADVDNSAAGAAARIRAALADPDVVRRALRLLHEEDLHDLPDGYHTENTPGLAARLRALYAD